MSKQGLSARRYVPHQTPIVVNARLPKGNFGAGIGGETAVYRPPGLVPGPLVPLFRSSHAGNSVLAAPDAGPWQRTAAASLLAVTVELSQFWHTETLDAFRSTTIGVLLIGRYFSWWDIVAYLIGIAAAALVDTLALRSTTT
jgi:Protein of unknown function (DUF2809)